MMLGGLVVLANIPLMHYGIRHVLMEMPTTATVPFQDDFSRLDVGPNYWATGGMWRIENGELHSPGVKNNPLWLQAHLPDNVSIDFDVRSMNPEGDIKFELFGDGLNHSSGYVFIFGGWGNQISTIARLNEHAPSFSVDGVGLPGADPEQNAVSGRTLSELFGNGTFGEQAEWRMERRDMRVQPGQMYHMHLEAKDDSISWYVNNQLIFHLQDKFRFKGKSHDRFGPSSWDTDLFFDNLTIQPL